MRVQVVRAWPRQCERVELDVPEGACVADAIAASGLVVTADAAYAVYGELAEATRPLRDGDRVELLRPLLVDPKHARRLRERRAAR